MISWVTVIWVMVAASCLPIAVVHAFVWLRGRRHRANVVFSLLAVSLAAFAFVELAMMRAEDLESYLVLHRLAHLAIFFVVATIVLFIRVYFGVGNRGVIAAILLLRAAIVVLAWVPGPTFNYSSIEAFETLTFLGEEVAVIRGPASPWARLGELSILLLLVFVAEASWRAFRSSDRARRKSVAVIGSSVFLCVAASIGYSFLLHSGRLEGPYVLSLSFLFIVGAMARELGMDTIRAARLADDLAEHNESMALAARSASLALWRWDIPDDSIWVSSEGRRLYGLPSDAPINLGGFLETLHPEDHDATRRAVEAALADGGEFHADYRISQANSVRWIEAWGRVEFGPAGEPLRMRGVSLDATERRRAENEAMELRAEIAHAGRVTLLGQLSSALAHELSQPLGAILRNSEAAALMLDEPSPDLDELREIIRDIHADDRRAGEVIERLRSLLKHRRLELQSVSATALASDAIDLVRADAAEKNIVLESVLPETAIFLQADRVHLLQVLLNLLVNAIDAVSRASPPTRQVTLGLAARDGHAEFRVRDSGPGIPADAAGRLFEPFFTTKSEGMGIGLAVCRTIVEAHQGTIEATNPAGGGAEFRCTIPLVNPLAHDSDRSSRG